ncbi:hypothetical protein G9A89_007120, partial [Geosiphon pyriformis]
YGFLFNPTKEIFTCNNMESIFNGVKLSWARMDLVHCKKYGHFGHLALKCNTPDAIMLSSSKRLYKKGALEKVYFWLAKFGFILSGSGPNLSPHELSGLGSISPPTSTVFSGLSNYLAVLERSLELLADQVFEIIKKLSFVELVPLASKSSVLLLVIPAPLDSVMNSDMAIDDTLVSPVFSPIIVVDTVTNFSLSSSKVLTSKVGGLEFKLVALEVSVKLVLEKLDCLCSGLDSPASIQVDIVHWHMNSGNIMSFVTETKLRFNIKPWIANKFESICVFMSGLEEGFFGAGVAHVSKIKKMPGQVVSVRLLFKGKLSVTVLGLYAGAFSSIYFGQASKMNFIIAKAINSSTFVVLGEDFNECGSGKSASFRFCLNLGLVNSFTIGSVSEFFNTDYNAVTISVGLGGLLNIQDCSSAKILMVKAEFLAITADHNLDAMWSLLYFLDIELELLVAKIVKKLGSVNILGFDHLAKKWTSLNAVNVLALKDMVVLDHLMVNDELILEPNEVRLSVNSIMEGWMRKCVVSPVLPGLWAHQYALLNYVRDDTFSGVIDAISLDVLFSVVGGLPNGKTTGLSVEVSFGVVEHVFICWYGVCFSYNWDGVLTNTQPIALIETARKILSKILSNYISLAYDNFLVFHDMSMQFLVFVVGSVMENALEKNREVWLVLQDMQKHIKMCERFIGFFGNIHKDRVNRVMPDFGLLDGYKSKVFSPLLWKIFYNPLLCKVKRHEQLCGYYIDLKFVMKTGRIKGIGRMMSYFAAGIFVDDTIWVGNCQASTQYALNIASEFFEINNISINNNKTVTISINQDVKIASLNICGQPISIAKKGKAHCYLRIFLSTERLSKPSIAKAHLDICFFVNVVLRKTITDKQYSYLVSAILQPIISYQIQFSYVSSGVCHKWDVMVRKGLKSKAGLSRDFLNAALHHPSLYGLKTFEQVQSERKIAALVFFSNASGVLGRLFNHRFLDLQILGWASLNPFQFPVKLHVSPVDNFLAGIVKIFLDNKLSLVNNLLNAFYSFGYFPMSSILGNSLYFNSKKLDSRGPVPHWFSIASEFLLAHNFFLPSSTGSGQSGGLNILESDVFSAVKDSLHNIWSNCFKVYIDGFLKGAGSADVTCDAAAYFLALDLSVGIVIHGFLSSTLAKLQAIALSLECVLSSCKLVLHIDSQAAINFCLSELSSAVSNFRNQCLLERHHIFNLIRDKDLKVIWVKVKRYSDIFGNVKADLAAGKAAQSSFTLLAGVCKQFLVAENTAVSGNAYHFVRDIFQSVSHAYWEAGPGCGVVSDGLVANMDWILTTKMWHLNSDMLAEFISQNSLNLRTYLMKVVHRCLPVAVQKKLYDKRYSSVLCLLCGEVEFLDHVFMCAQNIAVHNEVLAETFVHWISVAGICNLSSFTILWALSVCSLDVSLYSINVFDDKKQAVDKIVNFVRFVMELHCVKVVWIEKAGLVVDGGVISGLFCNVSSMLSNGVVRLLGVVESFAVSFGHHRLCYFFSGLGGDVCVNIDV